MSEIQIKSSSKKGFTAPVLLKQDNVTKSEQKENGASVEKPKKPKKKETNNKRDSEEGGINAEKQMAKKTLNKKAKENERETKELKASSHSEKKQQKKPEVSLTESQYDDIFNAVLLSQQGGSNSQVNTPKHDSEGQQKLKENSSSNEEKVTNSGKQKLKRPSKDKMATTSAKQAKKVDSKTLRPSTPKNKPLSVPELSPWGSHFSKQPSQGSSILKELQESQNSLMNSSALLSPCTTSSSDSEDDKKEPQSQHSLCQLSQLSGFGSQGLQNFQQHTLKGANQRERLQELQAFRNVGVWVYCCRMSCQKQRYLAKITDPQDVPDIWYCHMNPDPKYNSCECEEQKLSAEEEADMIYNQFTAGSIVWARVAGFPWWPAMVDDDPDLEQYYWLEEDLVTVTYYHVVFFDEVSVTRAWVNLKNISPYKKHDNKCRQRVTRGVDYTRRIMVAREQANDALTLGTAQRLKVYSFISRYEGPITTSAAKAKKTMTKYKLKVNVEKKEAAKFMSNKKEKESTKAQTKESSNQKEKKKMNATEKLEKRKADKRDAKENVLHAKKTKVQREREDKVKKDKKQKKSKEILLQDVLKNLNESVENAKENKKDSTCSETEKECTENVEQILNVPHNTPEEIFEKNENTKEKEVKENVQESNEENGTAKVKDNLEKQIHESFKESSKLNPEVENSKTEKIQESLKHFSPLPCTSTAVVESETNSVIKENLSPKSKSSGRFKKNEQNTEDTFCSVIEPSQNEREGRVEDGENKLSQSTIADFFGAESEDAVVPEGALSQMSLPFEE